MKRVARYCDPLSSRVLEEKANELGLCNTNTSLSVPQRASGKRKRGQSNSTTPFIVWTDSVSECSNRSSSFNIYDISRQVEQSPPETGFNSGVLTPNSNITDNDDTNANTTIPGNDIDCGAVVEPQNQVPAFNQPSPRFHDRFQDANWSSANEVILKAVGSRPLICEDGTHGFDGTDLITKPAVNLIISSTQPRTFPNTETLFIIRNCGISDVVPREL